MNPDDPKFTAYALDELDPAERAEIEKLLCEDPALAAEVEETRAFAAQLRERLRTERAEPLHAAQRAEVLACSAPTPAHKVSVFPRRKVAWMALAASIAMGAGVALFLPALHRMERPVARSLANEASHDGSKVQVKLSDDLAAVAVVKDVPLAETTAPVLADQPVETLAFSAPRPVTATGSLAGAAPVRLGEPAASSVSGPAKRADDNLGTLDAYVLYSDLESKLLGNVEASPRADGLDRGRSKNMDERFGSAVAPSKPPAAQPTAGGDAITLEKSKAPARFAAIKPTMAGRAGGARGEDVLSESLLQQQEATAGVELRLALVDANEREVARRERYFYRLPEDIAKKEVTDLMRRGDSPGTEAYEEVRDNDFLKVTAAPLSTFSIDVDTASYANVRRFLNNNALPPKGAVRIEELVNYFSYDYPQPDGDTPFSAAMEVAACPWAPEHRLLRVALHGREIARAQRPASNLVFLIDVSGSMEPENKLPLLKRSLQLMVDQLSERDRVAIVVYAGAAGLVLDSTNRKEQVRAALDRLESGGSTHGSAGLQLAYELAEKHFIKGATNRVILATDGDWNVGVTNKNDLWSMIERKAKSGVFLTVLGFGMDNLKDDMLERLADKGNGNYAYIDTLNEGRKVLVDELGATLVTIAKDVKIQIEFNPAQVSAYRLIGYENRVLAAKDFADDTKDAGEIGAGHSVTAFYELIPAGKELPALTQVEELKYQKLAKVEADVKAPALLPADPENKELLTLKLRYKVPDGDKSTLREFPLKDAGRGFANSSRDFRFAAAVAGYGMLLRQSPQKGSTSWELVHELAVEGKGEDRDGYRAEFVGLVEKARALMR